MSRKIILTIFILTYSLSYGQYDWTPGKLVLKNGETLKGLFKIPVTSGGLISKTKLEYKKDKKKKKFDETEVDKIFFTGFISDLGYYEYLPISTKKRALFKLVRNGKVKLYLRTIKRTVNTGFQSKEHPFGKKKIKKIKQYYMIRNNEMVATRVFNELDGLAISNNWNLQTFKTYAKKYFSDCANVLSYIDDDLYEDFDIAQIVDDYNLLCE